MKHSTATDWSTLYEQHEIANFRADVCVSSPESYSLDEKRRICREMENTTRAIDDAMREDFSAMPPKLQGSMLNLLQQADPDNFGWWLETLVGKTPDAPPTE